MRFDSHASEGVKEPRRNMAEIDIKMIKQRKSQCFEEGGNEDSI
jgi:hypothetical protein